MPIFSLAPGVGICYTILHKLLIFSIFREEHPLCL